ncbi:MAG TPA: hypothetical protein VIM10_14220 [Actinopolymorphaceae bacterium]
MSIVQIVETQAAQGFDDLHELRSARVVVDGAPVPFDLASRRIAPAAADPQPVQIEPQAELDGWLDADDPALVLPPPRRLAVTPDREALVRLVRGRDIGEEIDHRPAEQLFAVVSQPLAGLARRFAFELQQDVDRRRRPAVERSLRGHLTIITAPTDSRRPAIR